ncbi:MAG: hypothetical protein ACU0BS_08845 [Hasllibacter sp.]
MTPHQISEAPEGHRFAAPLAAPARLSATPGPARAVAACPASP